MIEKDLAIYLNSDSTLDTLLGVTSGNSKIYPEVPQTEPTLPYIVYTASYDATDDEHIKDDRIQITITGGTRAIVESIRDRLLVLLDKQDLIQDTTFTSTDYYIYWCKLTGGDISYEPVRGYKQCILFFTIRYQKKT